ncbi:hypothetical protein M5K25_024985 [Dendrobium thyrsiflorum]|uniref:Uncharacterized protein n=1 Tax=Dendrobium thyrsiflorum TaxID=117978 RepID=A0ABD0U377_DENTH
MEEGWRCCVKGYLNKEGGLDLEKNEQLGSVGGRGVNESSQARVKLNSSSARQPNCELELKIELSSKDVLELRSWQILAYINLVLPAYYGNGDTCKTRYAWELKAVVTQGRVTCRSTMMRLSVRRSRMCKHGLKVPSEKVRMRNKIERLQQMVGEWMMDPIKIPWFRRPGSSWSPVYLVRGGSRPNMTEGSLSATMGCVIQGTSVIEEHMSSSYDRNLVVQFGGKPPGSESPNHNNLPAVPFDDKTADKREIDLMNGRVHRIGANWAFKQLVDASGRGDPWSRRCSIKRCCTMELGKLVVEMGRLILIHSIARRHALYALQIHTPKAKKTDFSSSFPSSFSSSSS